MDMRRAILTEYSDAIGLIDSSSTRERMSVLETLMMGRNEVSSVLARVASDNKR
jgi:hypothetical protein